MAQEMHPFWQGVYQELKKEAIWDTLAALPGLAVSHPLGAIAMTGLAGAGLIAGARGLRVPGFAKKAPASLPLPTAPPPPEAAAQAAKGFGWKALAGTGAGAAALGYYAGRKKRDE